MSMSMHVCGFAPPDDDWKKQKAVWDVCREAGIEPPNEVYKFFNGATPDEAGVSIDIPFERYESEGSSGFQIELNKIPPHVKYIRFWNSW